MIRLHQRVPSTLHSRLFYANNLTRIPLVSCLTRCTFTGIRSLSTKTPGNESLKSEKHDISNSLQKTSLPNMNYNKINPEGDKRPTVGDFNVFDQMPHQALPQVDRVSQEGFTVSNVNLRGGILLFNGGIFLWDVFSVDQLNKDAFKVFELVVPLPDVLVIGTGRTMQRVPQEVSDMFKSLGIQFECLPTRNACSTYNILVEEDRNVGLAVLPINPVSAREKNPPESRDD